MKKPFFVTPTWLIVLSAILIFNTGRLPAGESEGLRAAVDASHRTPANVARDKYRHPYETLRFFGLKPDMSVVEISPGTGAWYMEIIAPLLKEKGSYIAASYDGESDEEYYRRGHKKFSKKLKDNPDLFEKVTVTVFNPPHKLAIAPAGSADMVLTFRNVHNWMEKENGAEAAFSAFYRALKPGGILGVVEHRAGTDSPQDPKADNGYVREDYVIALAEAAGFTLVESSEINANLMDTKDYENGVWELLPRLRVADSLKERRRSIGESDRMTLKFVKAK